MDKVNLKIKIKLKQLKISSNMPAKSTEDKSKPLEGKTHTLILAMKLKSSKL